MSASRRFLAIPCLAAVLLCAAPAEAQLAKTLGRLTGEGDQQEEKKADQPAQRKAELKEKRAEIAEQLRLAQKATDESKNGEPSDGPKEDMPPRTVELLKTMEALIGQQQAAEDRREELERRLAAIEQELEKFRTHGPEERPPYSFLLLDQLRDELTAESAKSEFTWEAVRGATAALERAQRDRDEAERRRRLAQEAVDTNKDPAKTPRLTTELQTAELESKAAAELVKLRQLELANEKLAQAVQEKLVKLLEEKAARVAQDATFSEADLEAQLTELEQREAEIKRELESAEINLSYLDEKWTDARSRLDTTKDNRAFLTEEVEAWRLARQKRQQEIAVFNRRLRRIGEVGTAWRRRFQVISQQPTSNQLHEWEEEARAALAQLERERSLLASQMDQVRADMATLEKKLAANGTDEELLRWLTDQRRHLGELMRIYGTDLVSIEAARRLHDKLLAEITADSGALSAGEWFQAFWRHAQAVWNYELANIEDRPLTVRKVVWGIVLFVLGLVLSKVVSSVLQRRLLAHTRMNEDAAAVLRVITFYTLLIVFTLFALRLVNVPLTVFTVAGGALAIGVGLGSQGLITNFLSGLVIMAERPMRLGERIVFQNFDGIVEEVSYRATKVRLLNGHLVTIPNSQLINDTLENVGRRPYIRRKMDITITYDTPREKIAEAVDIVRGILEEEGIRERIHPPASVAKRIHPAIIGDQPAPRVYFNDFNADSLNIVVFYWFSPPDYWDYLEHSERVNLRIFEEFEKADIDFAFPSQTLYLARDAKRDLAVQVLEGQTPDPGHGEAAA